MKFWGVFKKPVMYLVSWTSDYRDSVEFWKVIKIKVYYACVLTLLHAWVVYCEHLTLLECFHQQCLHWILGINWRMHVSDLEVFERSQCNGIETIILKYRLHWNGHVVHMTNIKIPKQLLYRELANGKWPYDKPKKHYKDGLKESQNLANINT